MIGTETVINLPIQFCWYTSHDVDGKERKLRFGRGLVDDSVWFDADAWQMPPELLEELKRDYGAEFLLHPKDGRLYVSMDDIIASCDPELQRRLLAQKAEWLDVLHPSNFKPMPNDPPAAFLR
jgi:hypothetical protein